jgi:hypothetical protein
MLLTSSVLADVLPHLEDVVARGTAEAEAIDPTRFSQSSVATVSQLFAGTSISYGAVRARPRSVESRQDDAADAPASPARVDDDDDEASSARPAPSAAPRGTDDDPLQGDVTRSVRQLRMSTGVGDQPIVRFARRRGVSVHPTAPNVGQAVADRTPSWWKKISRNVNRRRDNSAYGIIAGTHVASADLARYLLREWLDANAPEALWPSQPGLMRSPLAVYGLQLAAITRDFALLNRWSRVLDQAAKDDTLCREAWCVGRASDGIVPFAANPFVKWAIAVAIVEHEMLASAARHGAAPQSPAGYVRVSRKIRQMMKGKRRVQLPHRNDEGAKTKFLRDLELKVTEAFSHLHTSVATANVSHEELARDLVRAVYPLVLAQRLPTAARSRALVGANYEVWRSLWRRYLRPRSTEQADAAASSADSELGLKLQRDLNALAVVREKLVLELRAKGRADKAWGASDRNERVDVDKSPGFTAELNRRVEEHKHNAETALRNAPVRPLSVSLQEGPLPAAAHTFLLFVCRAEALKLRPRPLDPSRADVTEFATEVMRQHALQRYTSYHGQQHLELMAAHEVPHTAAFKPQYAVLHVYLQTLAYCGDLRVVDCVVNDLKPAVHRHMSNALVTMVTHAVEKQALLATQPEQAGLTVRTIEDAVYATAYSERLSQAWRVPPLYRAKFNGFRARLCAAFFTAAKKAPASDGFWNVEEAHRCVHMLKAALTPKTKNNNAANGSNDLDAVTLRAEVLALFQSASRLPTAQESDDDLDAAFNVAASAVLARLPSTPILAAIAIAATRNSQAHQLQRNTLRELAQLCDAKADGQRYPGALGYLKELDSVVKLVIQLLRRSSGYRGPMASGIHLAWLTGSSSLLIAAMGTSFRAQALSSASLRYTADVLLQDSSPSCRAAQRGFLASVYASHSRERMILQCPLIAAAMCREPTYRPWCGDVTWLNELAVQGGVIEEATVWEPGRGAFPLPSLRQYAANHAKAEEINAVTASDDQYWSRDATVRRMNAEIESMTSAASASVHDSEVGPGRRGRARRVRAQFPCRDRHCPPQANARLAARPACEHTARRSASQAARRHAATPGKAVSVAVRKRTCGESLAESRV